jgi:hypothetical protein
VPLYEVVLCFHDRVEVRITDRDPRTDGHVKVGERRLPLTAVAVTTDPKVTRRYYVRVDDPAVSR